jgi:hypothetical protein
MTAVNIQYPKGGRTSGIATFETSSEWIAQVADTLAEVRETTIPCDLKVQDLHGTVLTVGTIHWHIKLRSQIAAS